MLPSDRRTFLGHLSSLAGWMTLGRRSGQQPVVVNLDLPNVEPNPESVHWVDNIHPEPKT